MSTVMKVGMEIRMGCSTAAVVPIYVNVRD